MPRIRSVKPEYWADFPTAQLSRDARLLFIALWNFADEHGRLAGDPRFVKGQVFPYDDDLDPDAVDGLLEELHDAGNIVRYRVEGAPYIVVPKLGRHQRLEPGKVPSRIPPPPDPNNPGPGRADSSESGADESARNSEHRPVENSPSPAEATFPQVNGASKPRVDKSAQDADSSTLLYGAGSMEHAAAAADADRLPPAVAILRAKLNARRLVVRWDKLTRDQLTTIEDLVALHGDEPLVKQALASFQPASPPVFAQAWLESWIALPAPGTHLQLAPEPACPHPGHNGTTRRCNECASEALAGNG